MVCQIVLRSRGVPFLYIKLKGVRNLMTGVGGVGAGQ